MQLAAMSPMIQILPVVNASLNGVAAILLLIGFILIKKGKVDAHRRTMLSAFGVSVVFLISYLTYHTLRGMEEGQAHTKWEVDGVIRWVYYGILISHVILAAAVPILAILTLRLGLKNERARHKRLAKITWPIWMYVSVTGVVVYVMLYHIQPMMMRGGG